MKTTLILLLLSISFVTAQVPAGEPYHTTLYTDTIEPATAGEVHIDDELSVGTLAQATGTNAIALGQDSVASQTNAIAIGEDAQATGSWATAIGYLSTASGLQSVAVGRDAQALGTWSLALGRGSVADDTDAIAIGSINVQGSSIGIGLDSAIPTTLTTDNVLSIMNGDVGIQTTTPTAPLDVNGQITATELQVNGQVRAQEICDETGANCHDVSTGWSGGGGADTDWTESSGDIYRSSGEVGIGITTPVEKLHIDGDLHLDRSADSTVPRLKLTNDVGSGKGITEHQIFGPFSGSGVDGALYIAAGDSADGSSNEIILYRNGGGKVPQITLDGEIIDANGWLDIDVDDGADGTASSLSGKTPNDGLSVLGGDGGHGYDADTDSFDDGGPGGDGSNIVLTAGNAGTGGDGEVRNPTDGGRGGDGGNIVLTPGVGARGGIATHPGGSDGSDGADGIIQLNGLTELLYDFDLRSDNPTLLLTDTDSTNDWEINAGDTTQGGGTTTGVIFRDLDSSRVKMVIQQGGIDAGNVVADASFQNNGVDYAEWMLKDNVETSFEPGDLVGIREGKVTYNTNADSLMVVSSSPGFIGGGLNPNEKDENFYQRRVMIAFIGQVPVKVEGKVKAGDYILPSGRNDGVGVAKAKSSVSFDEYKNQVVGVAWESSDDEAIKLINVGVGIK